MTHASTAIDHVGRDFFVAALAEFYATTGFVDTGPHHQRRVSDPNVVHDAPCSAVRTGDASGRPGGGGPDIIADRRAPGTYLAIGQPTEIELSIYATEPVRIRDRIPSGWTVVDSGGDASTTYTEGGVRYVEFDTELTAGTVSYAAKPPSHSSATRVGFGPMEYSPDDGDTWLPVAATDRQHSIPQVDSCT